MFEAARGEPLVRKPDDAARIVEACWAKQCRAALLYPENLTPRFFDLGSGEAGAILDKVRRFRVRIAVVCPPGEVTFSSRFREILCDDFQVFETRDAAIGWLQK
ncbi:MAG TPA: DUF4180 domain-containing protein [Vicinamibacterales bacterium]|nr:DUF4180 domain-containing protein [Vicinamibacterales bacterium]